MAISINRVGANWVSESREKLSNTEAMTYEEENHAPEKPRRTNESLAGDFRYLQITGRGSRTAHERLRLPVERTRQYEAQLNA